MVNQTPPRHTGRQGKQHQNDGNTGSSGVARLNATTALISLVTALVALLAAVVPLYLTARSNISALHKKVKAQQSTIQEQRKAIATKRNSPPKAPEGGQWLSNTNPVNDPLNAQAAPVVLGGIRYPNSITMQCYSASPPGELYRVSGPRFTAVVGIADGAGSSFQNITDTITFTNQSGRLLGDRVYVTLGRPEKVSVPLVGVNEISISCSGRNTVTGSTDVGAPPISLGNATSS